MESISDFFNERFLRRMQWEDVAIGAIVYDSNGNCGYAVGINGGKLTVQMTDGSHSFDELENFYVSAKFALPISKTGT